MSKARDTKSSGGGSSVGWLVGAFAFLIAIGVSYWLVRYGVFSHDDGPVAVAVDEDGLAQAEDDLVDEAADLDDEEGMDPEEDEAEEPAEPQRPEDFADWTPDDFRSAAAEADARLPQAIQALCEKATRGDEQTALLLVELIHSEAPATSDQAPKTDAESPTGAMRSRVGGMRMPGSRRSRRVGALSMEQVVTHAIDALAVIGTESAEQTLEEIIRGTFATHAADADATSAALSAVAAHMDPRHEELLYEVITAPEQVRPEKQGGVSAAELQRQVLDLVADVASIDFRNRLAKHIAGPGGGAAGHEQVMQMLLDPVAENLQAQVTLYTSGPLPPEVQEDVRAMLTFYARMTLDRSLGVPADAVEVALPQRRRSGGGMSLPGRGGMRLPGSGGRRRKTGDGTTSEPADFDPAAAVTLLWSPEFSTVVASSIAQQATISEEGAPLLGMATALPLPDVRKSLSTLLRDNWQQGLDPLGGDAFVTDARDPGLLLVLKSLPRRQSPEPASRSRGLSLQNRSRTGDEDANPEEKARYAWMDASENLVRVLCSRLHAAAQSGQPNGDAAEVADDAPADGEASAAAAAVPDETSETEPKPAASPDGDGPDPFGTRAAVGAEAGAEQMPLTLHSRDGVVAEYHRRLPTVTADGQATGVGTLAVHYVRMEEEAQLDAIVRQYARKLERSRTYELDDARWIDQMLEQDDQPTAISVDVLITPTGSAPAAADGRRRRTPPQPLVIEVLAIEIPAIR